MNHPMLPAAEYTLEYSDFDGSPDTWISYSFENPPHEVHSVRYIKVEGRRRGMELRYTFKVSGLNGQEEIIGYVSYLYSGNTRTVQRIGLQGNGDQATQLLWSGRDSVETTQFMEMDLDYRGKGRVRMNVDYGPAWYPLCQLEEGGPRPRGEIFGFECFDQPAQELSVPFAKLIFTSGGGFELQFTTQDVSLVPQMYKFIIAAFLLRRKEAVRGAFV